MSEIWEDGGCADVNQMEQGQRAWIQVSGLLLALQSVSRVFSPTPPSQ